MVSKNGTFRASKVYMQFVISKGEIDICSFFYDGEILWYTNVDSVSDLRELADFLEQLKQTK